MTATTRRLPATAGAWRWSEGQRFLVDADRRLRRPIPTSRRISVLSLAGGTGASTLAAGVATLAARRRGTPVLAVDADGARHGLGERIGFAAEEGGTPPLGSRADAGSFAEASEGLSRTGTLFYAGLGHPASASWPADAGEWRSAVGPIGRFFPLVLTDWGRRRDLRTIADITRTSHAVCLVAPADRAGLEQAAALVPALRAETPRPDVLVVLVDRVDLGPGPTRVRVGTLDAAVVRVPFDRALAAGAPARRRTRRAMLAIAAELVAGDSAREEVPV